MTYDAALDAALGDDHLRVDVDQWENVFVVGDVHGCLAEFDALLDLLAPGPDELVILVGDLVRKGPASRAVVERVRATQNVIAVRGNNEEKILRGTVDEPALDEFAEYFASLPVAISFDDSVVVHGGVDPRRPLAEHGAETFLTTRAIPPGGSYDGPFWFESYEGPPRVFFGHTVLSGPYRSRSAVGLDTGCVYGGALSAFDWRRGEIRSVDARRTYQERPGAKVIEPAEVIAR